MREVVFSMKLNALSIPAIIGTIVLSFIPSGDNYVRGSGHWEWDNYYQQSFYVYETREEAVFEGESDGVAYFETKDGNVWGAYVWDSAIQAGDEVTLTFENRITQSEYAQAEEYGIEYGTREDSGAIIAIE